jgi:low temperature requirement protein LtrA
MPGILLRRMVGRDPAERHRASTPLELLFDLCFVVAVAQAAAQLHHALAAGHAGSGLLGYLLVFFAIWWAWVNFTWFASAYDTDDVPYRLLTLVQIAGGLVLAAGVPAAFERYDFGTVVAGYVIMRLAMVVQWLRAARQDPAGRPAALRYCVGIVVVQAGWIARLWAPGPWAWVTFGVLAAADMAVPVWAEYRGARTAWHPGHINERYGLFTLIVLGESVSAATVAIQAAVTGHGLSAGLVVTAASGLVLLFGLWWSYFKHESTEELRVSLGTTVVWAYCHYPIFAALAAVGAGLEVAAEHDVHLPAAGVAATVAVPVCVYLLVSGFLHAGLRPGSVDRVMLVVTAVLVLAAAPAATLIGVPAALAAIALLTAALLAAGLALGRPISPR